MEDSMRALASPTTLDPLLDQAGPIGDPPELARRPIAPEAPTLNRRLKDLSKRGLRVLFEVGQRCGVDILPRHFYSEVPEIRALRRDAAWKMPRSMVGVAGADHDSQFDFFESCCRPQGSTQPRRLDIFPVACARNGEPGFGPVDADFLYGFLQAVRPKKVVQIGCGVSTAIMQLAIEDTTDYRPEIVCIEPCPTDYLRRADRAGEIRLVAEKAQAVALETLTDLGDDGFLFIDSTHTVKPGSEVNRLVFEVLPRLRPGSWVHFHDIYFPYDYQRGILDDELFFSNETALVHAFLINNCAYSIAVSLSMLHHADPARLQRSLPNYLPAGHDHGLRTRAGHFPGSLYLRAVSATGTLES
jgi:predicted O-methyltransferase YrrM